MIIDETNAAHTCIACGQSMRDGIVRQHVEAGLVYLCRVCSGAPKLLDAEALASIERRAHDATKTKLKSAERWCFGLGFARRASLLALFVYAMEHH